jgi:hypothetical protein
MTKWDTKSQVAKDKTRHVDIKLQDNKPEEIARVRALLSAEKDAEILLAMLGIENAA